MRGLLRLLRINQAFIERQREINAAIINTFIGAAFWGDLDADPLSISELSKELGVAPTTVSRHLRYLGEGIRKGRPGMGLVATFPHPDDARNKIIRLTEAGRDLRNQLSAYL